MPVESKCLYGAQIPEVHNEWEGTRALFKECFLGMYWHSLHVRFVTQKAEGAR
jgi:hypothetical protein